MARKQSWNPAKLTAELNAADEAIAPILAATKITSITVGGESKPASEAPLPDRIKAVGSLISTGDKTIDNAELIASNGALAAQVEELEGKNTVVNATSAAQAQKIVELDGKLTVATGSVTTLTAKNTELTGLLDASNKEAGRVTGLVNSQKLSLARKCQSVNAVDFKGADGKTLAADCSDADLATASKEVTFDSMLASYNGAFNANFLKLTGTDLSKVPAAGAQPAAGKKQNATDECLAAVKAKSNK